MLEHMGVPHGRRRGVAALIVAALALSVSASGGDSSGATLAGFGSSGGPAFRSGDAPGAGPQATGTFSISGSMKGLFPGVSLPLVLTVSNPWRSAINVTSITTTVSAASLTCVAANVKVSSFVGKLFVPAVSKRKLTVHVKMAHAAPNACQGKVFPFRYHGLATVA